MSSQLLNHKPCLEIFNFSNMVSFNCWGIPPLDTIEKIHQVHGPLGVNSNKGAFLVCFGSFLERSRNPSIFVVKISRFLFLPKIEWGTWKNYQKSPPLPPFPLVAEFPVTPHIIHQSNLGQKFILYPSKLHSYINDNSIFHAILCGAYVFEYFLKSRSIMMPFLNRHLVFWVWLNLEACKHVLNSLRRGLFYRFSPDAFDWGVKINFDCRLRENVCIF